MAEQGGDGFPSGDGFALDVFEHAVGLGETFSNLEGAWALTRLVLDAIFASDWPPRAAPPTADPLFFSAASLSDLFLGDVPDADYQHRLVAEHEQQRFAADTLIEPGAPTARFFDLKGYNILRLATEIESIELEERWPALLPRDTIEV